MNRLLLVLIGLMGFTSVVAAPFIVSDALDPRATHCGWKMDAGTRTDVAVTLSGADKICKLDLAGLATGPHTVSATAVAVDPIWGRVESPASANFTFAVPTTPTVPSGLKLAP